MSNKYAVEFRTKTNLEMLHIVDAFSEVQAALLVEAFDDVHSIEAVRIADNADIAFFKQNYKDPLIIH